MNIHQPFQPHRIRRDRNVARVAIYERIRYGWQLAFHLRHSTALFSKTMNEFNTTLFTSSTLLEGKNEEIKNWLFYSFAE